MSFPEDFTWGVSTGGPRHLAVWVKALPASGGEDARGRVEASLLGVVGLSPACLNSRVIGQLTYRRLSGDMFIARAPSVKTRSRFRPRMLDGEPGGW